MARPLLSTAYIPHKLFYLLVFIASALLNVLAFPAAASQTPQIIAVPLPSSLEGKATTKFYLDKQGILWIGTQSGLIRYDGIGTQLYGPRSDSDRGIFQSYIQDISEDALGNLYVATERGHIFRQNDALGKFDHFSLGEKQPHTIRWIHASDNGALWIGTGKGVWFHKIDASSTQSRVFHKRVGGIAADTLAAAHNNDRIFIAQGERLLVGDDSIPKLDNLDLPQTSDPSANITALDFLDKDTIAVGRSSGVIEVYDISSTPRQLLFSKQVGRSLMITDLLSMADGILVATDDGLYLMTNNSKEVVRIDARGEGLNHPDIFDLFKLDEQILIATFSGPNIFSTTSFEHFRRANSKERIHVNAFGEDKSGGIWIGTQTGLYQLPKSQGRSDAASREQRTVSEHPEVGDRVSAVQATSDGIAIGFRTGGLKILSTTSDEVSLFDFPSLSTAGIVDLVSTADETMWIATHQNGLFQLIDNQLLGPLGVGVIGEKFIFWVLEIDDSHLLIGGSENLYIYKKSCDCFHKVTYSVQGNSEKLSLISASRNIDGDIWFGTEDHGLYFLERYNEKQHSIVLEKRGAESDLRYDTIYSVSVDSAGNLWMPTQRGIVKANSEGEFLWRFGPGDGLQGDDFHWGAAHTASDGAMYFGGPNGFNKFYPEDVVIDRTPPRTILSKIHFPDVSYLNFRKSPESTSVQVSHNDRFITFEAGIVSPKDSLNSRFRFQLEGFDPEWVYTGDRNTATYTNLPHGDYVFLAQGANTAGIWDPKGLRIPVTVLPPPWLSWWAYCIYTLIALIAGWAAHRTYQSYVIQRHAAELARQIVAVEEAAEDEMEEQLEFQEAILDSAYGHKKQTLKLIGSVLDQPSGETADGKQSDENPELARRLHALDLLEECMMYGLEGAQVNLHQYVEMVIEELLETSPVNPDTIVTTNDVPTALLSASAASPIAIMLFELVENSIQHAFKEDSLANYIYIKVSVAARERWDRSIYTLSVSDSGIGAPENLFKSPKTDSGAALVAAVIKSCGASCDVDTGPGTSISITFTAEA